MAHVVAAAPFRPALVLLMLLTPWPSSQQHPGGPQLARGSRGRAQSSSPSAPTLPPSSSPVNAASTRSLHAFTLPAMTALEIRTGERWIGLHNTSAMRHKPLVSDANVAGSTQPPLHPLPPFNATELLQKPTHEYLAMCLITSVTAHDVREWIDHHIGLGAGRVYLFDHRPMHHNQSILPELQSGGWANLGKVEYQVVPDMFQPWRQFAVYELCLSYRRRHQWMAFFDSDEFLILKDPAVPDLATMLKGFETYGALAVNWRIFGTSGHRFRPNGSVLHDYTSCTPKQNKHNVHVKAIVNLKHVRSHGGNPHAFNYQTGFFPVNENKQALDITSHETCNGAKTMGRISTDRVVLNHYISKSLEDYKQKVLRGSVNRGPYKGLAWFQELEASCNETCTYAQKPAAA